MKDSPCFITYNNLGVFYAFEGLFKPNNSGRIATKLGLGYLKKAEASQISCLTLSAFGQICFKAKDYKGAAKYFEQACELKPDYYSIYNCGTSYYMAGAYDKATVWFQRALSICDDSDCVEAITANIFSLLYSDKEEFFAAAHKMFEVEDENIEWEKFVVAYFANDLLVAESLIEPMLKKFNVTLQDMAIVFDCLLRLGKEAKADECLKQKVESLGGYDYNTQPEIRRMRKAFFQADFRAELIAKYKYDISHHYQCCYYGCKMHNNNI